MTEDHKPLNVSVSDLRTALHETLDRVSRERQQVVVTRYGRPIAILTPYAAPEEAEGIFGCLTGSVTVHDDIVQAIGEPWEADG